jgi:hypothetical protein
MLTVTFGCVFWASAASISSVGVRVVSPRKTVTCLPLVVLTVVPTSSTS